MEAQGCPRACPRSPSWCAPPSPSQPLLLSHLTSWLQLPHQSYVCPAPDPLCLLGGVRLRVDHIPPLDKTLLWLPIALKIKTRVLDVTNTSCVARPRRLPPTLLLTSAVPHPLPPLPPAPCLRAGPPPPTLLPPTGPLHSPLPGGWAAVCWSFHPTSVLPCWVALAKCLISSTNSPLPKQESWRCSELPCGRKGPWWALNVLKWLTFEGQLGERQRFRHEN